jgi:hypothetical protein
MMEIFVKSESLFDFLVIVTHDFKLNFVCKGFLNSMFGYNEFSSQKL